MSVRLQWSDLGLAVAAVAAVVLIATFLAMTGGSPAENDDAAPPPTTAGRRTGLVRTTSTAAPELEWSRARGSFRVECEEGRVVYLDAKVTELPTAPRYGWRVLVDERSGQVAPLTTRPGVSAELLQGDGLPTAFRTTPAGTGTVRFTFAERRRDVIAPLGLIVLDVEPEEALVMAAPTMTCRRPR